MSRSANGSRLKLVSWNDDTRNTFFSPPFIAYRSLCVGFLFPSTNDPDAPPSALNSTAIGGWARPNCARSDGLSSTSRTDSMPEIACARLMASGGSASTCTGSIIFQPPSDLRSSVVWPLLVSLISLILSASTLNSFVRAGSPSTAVFAGRVESTK